MLRPMVGVLRYFAEGGIPPKRQERHMIGQECKTLLGEALDNTRPKSISDYWC
jgi:hypothetical protein